MAVRVSAHVWLSAARVWRSRPTDSLWIACESDPGELPAFFRLKEIAIGAANVSARCGAGTAAQDVLVAHEFAVVFAQRAGRGAIARDKASRRCASIPKRRQTFGEDADPLAGPLRQRTLGARMEKFRLDEISFDRTISTQRAPIRTRSAGARPPSSQMRRLRNN